MTVGQFMHEVQFTRPARGAIHFLMIIQNGATYHRAIRGIDNELTASPS